ncbi:hypothetical protein BV22DRAFT_831544 [Leucogyrophana mollusca]|uniref:Uncharacterized protein n=1 Tax=Leucogyrophana mollusca TaxID=85980 RepID=A0ACB8B599_9AGAM|nr:hypothetical protein BV22DRAFT_831544 [Leucogyrophana mollusca]
MGSLEPLFQYQACDYLTSMSSLGPSTCDVYSRSILFRSGVRSSRSVRSRLVKFSGVKPSPLTKKNPAVLNLADEVDLIWKRRWTFMTALYFAVRVAVLHLTTWLVIWLRFCNSIHEPGSLRGLLVDVHACCG